MLLNQDEHMEMEAYGENNPVRSILEAAYWPNRPEERRFGVHGMQIYIYSFANCKEYVESSRKGKCFSGNVGTETS
jgi:hypothetical protein